MTPREERRGTRKLMLGGIVLGLIVTLVFLFGPPLTRQFFPSGIGGSTGQTTQR
jgi:hypothetical protein